MKPRRIGARPQKRSTWVTSTVAVFLAPLVPKPCYYHRRLSGASKHPLVVGSGTAPNTILPFFELRAEENIHFKTGFRLEKYVLDLV